MTNQTEKSGNVTTFTLQEINSRLRCQGVSNRNHAAFVCPVCGTVQSIASLILAGADPNDAACSIGFSCEGRFNNAGPWVSAKDNTPKAQARRRIRGCNWTLGGVFKLHTTEVILPDGTKEPIFDLATSEQARQLESEICAPIPQDDTP